MEWEELSPEQQRQLEADHADFERQLVRTAVDLRAASAHMHEIEEPRRREVDEDEDEDEDTERFIMELTIDFTGILETLRRLPDGAGTSAFVAEYNATHRDWRDG